MRAVIRHEDMRYRRRAAVFGTHVDRNIEGRRQRHLQARHVVVAHRNGLAGGQVLLGAAERIHLQLVRAGRYARNRKRAIRLGEIGAQAPPRNVAMQGRQADAHAALRRCVGDAPADLKNGPRPEIEISVLFLARGQHHRHGALCIHHVGVIDRGIRHRRPVIADAAAAASPEKRKSVHRDGDQISAGLQ